MKFARLLEVSALAFFASTMASAAPAPFPTFTPGPLPTPVPSVPVPVLTCPLTNSVAPVREPREAGAPAYIFPDDTRESLGRFLRGVPDGSTVYIRSGTHTAFVDGGGDPTIRRVHLIGQGRSLTILRGQLSMRSGSTVEHLTIRNASLTDTLRFGMEAQVRHVTVEGGATGIHVTIGSGTEPDPITGRQQLECVGISGQAGMAISVGGELQGAGNGSTLKNVTVQDSGHTAYGALELYGNGFNLSQVSVRRSRGPGITIYGDFTQLSQVTVENTAALCYNFFGARLVMSRSTASNCGSYGIRFTGNGATVTDTVVRSAKGFGITLSGGTSTSILKVQRVTVDGVTPLASAPADATALEVQANGTGHLVTDSTFANAVTGILDRGAHPVLERNTFRAISGRETVILPR